MARGRPKRPWIKMYPVDCLMGSINYQLDLAERCIWYELIYFSAICATPGVIADKDGRRYPHQFIANRLNAPLGVFNRTLKKCQAEGRIFENASGIHITNWTAYQSEYERQKPYREAKKDREAKRRGEYATNVGTIEVGGEEAFVKKDSEDNLFYFDDAGEKVFVKFNDESEKYEPI